MRLLMPDTRWPTARSGGWLVLGHTTDHQGRQSKLRYRRLDTPMHSEDAAWWRTARDAMRPTHPHLDIRVERPGPGEALIPVPEPLRWQGDDS